MHQTLYGWHYHKYTLYSEKKMRPYMHGLCMVGIITTIHYTVREKKETVHAWTLYGRRYHKHTVRKEIAQA